VYKKRCSRSDVLRSASAQRANRLKWKPPAAISIDFRVQLRYPALSDALSTTVPDFTAKPAFLLMTDHGQAGLQCFDEMHVSDEEWEKWKAGGEQSDGRIVEVTWNQTVEKWVHVRFRDDKLYGNHAAVVEDILHSLRHGVEADTVSRAASQLVQFLRMSTDN
jgi:mRNA guanylyltransferase